MQQKYTTVLLVRNDKGKTISFNIKTTHILRWKYYTASVLSIFLVLTSLFIVYFARFSFFANENNKLAYKISDMERQIDLLDSMKVQNKINSIEERILNIDNYFRERGAKPDSMNKGGEPRTSGANIFMTFDFFDKYTENLAKNVTKIPLGYPYIGEKRTSEYGYRTNPFGGGSFEFHPGIDIKGNVGDPVKSTADGTILSTDWKNGYGKCVEISHKFGLTTIYGHLSAFNVKQGDKIKTGEIIGFLGSTGRSTGPHLHYEIRKDGTDIDPNIFLNYK